MNTTELYTQWLEKATADPDLQAELQAIAGQDEEIRDRFYRSLEFGTAGLRGVIGARYKPYECVHRRPVPPKGWPII